MKNRTVREAEVEWYRKHGRYKDRITEDTDGKKYVIGDESWNAQHHNAVEYIDNKIKIVYESCIDYIP